MSKDGSSATIARLREALQPFADAADRCDRERPPVATTNPEHGCTTFSYRTLAAARVALNREDADA